jgi:hypothetical protein
MAGQWEQFANNFKTFYELGNKVQTGLATRKILEEEVETLYNPDAAGPGVPHAGSNSQGGIGNRYRYDGKIYDQQITPEMLRGLQDRRIADAMIKFGDAEGATKMLTSKAQLKNLNLDNQVKEGTLEERIKKAKIDNDAKLKTMDLTDAQITRYNQLTPLMAEKYLADIEAQKVSTAQSVSKFANEKSILEDKATMSAYELKEYEADEANRDAQRGLTSKKIKLEDKEADLAMAKLKSGYETELANYNLELGIAKTQLEAEQLAANQNKLNQEVLTDFATKMANKEFESPEAQKAWLVNNWTGDPRVKTMIADIDAVQLSQITAEGTKMMAEVNAALSGKSQNGQKDALIKVMDMQDGISGNMQFITNEKGITQLAEYSSAEAMKADTKKTGEGATIVVNENGTKKGWDGFTEGLTAEFTPLKSLEIAKANADIAYIRAQTEFKLNESDMKLTLAESKAWGDHTQTETFRQLLTLTAADFEAKTGHTSLDDYAVDYIRRLRLSTGNTNFEDYSLVD